MKYFFLFFLLFFVNSLINAQKPTYDDSLKAFQKFYMDSHEVVKGEDIKFFSFFPINNKYRVIAGFEKINDAIGFLIKTSAGTDALYYKYGKLTFTLNDTAHQLFLYQSKMLLTMPDFKDYLFLPFTDNTNGIESYGGGRYIDIMISDIKNNKLIIDFNKAYNPYCAYAIGYQCPIPPKECNMPVSIYAGEKAFGKEVH